ncbi:MAG: AAA family ATPase, partial [Xenococcus sp. (in: cyanobacteria)]
MTKQYNNSTASDKSHFLITDHVEFNDSGRALCPACSPNYKNRSLTLALVPNGNGAYKCFRGCTPEEIRAALGHPKSQIIPTALAQPKEKKTEGITYDETRVVREHSDLMSLKSASLEGIRWLANRGITTDMVKRYKLGLARAKVGEKMVYAITIPIESKEKGKYYIKKRVAPWDKEIVKEKEYKRWVQYGVKTTIYFTHKPENATQTWLCEGEWDAIKLGWLISQYRDDVAVASFSCGCDHVPKKEDLQRLPGDVIIFYDRNDKLNKRGKRIGDEAAEKTAKTIGNETKIAKVPMPNNCTIKGWDVSDAINHGYQLENFERAALEAKVYKEVPSNSFLSKSRKLSQVYDEAPDYVEWLVPDLFTRNELYCLAAEPRAGKSLFALGLAKAIASGSTFLGRPCQQGEVVYVCKEDPDDKVKQRLIAQDWEREEMDNVLVNNDFTLDELPELIEYVKQYHPSLVVFDTLSRIQKNNARENSSEIADVLAPLQDLAQKEHVCILVVHHTRKKIQEELDITDIFDSVRGSGAIRATCRGMLVLAGTKQGYRLAVENGRTAVQDLAVYLNVANLTSVSYTQIRAH